MNRREAYEHLKHNPKNVRFEGLCRSAEAFGFHRKGGKGSHTVYVRDGIPDILNFQNAQGKAKPYQMRRLLKIIEHYTLLEDDDAA